MVKMGLTNTFLFDQPSIIDKKITYMEVHLT